MISFTRMAINSVKMRKPHLLSVLSIITGTVTLMLIPLLSLFIKAAVLVIAEEAGVKAVAGMYACSFLVVLEGIILVGFVIGFVLGIISLLLKLDFPYGIIGTIINLLSPIVGFIVIYRVCHFVPFIID